MPRKYIRKTQRTVDENAVKLALRDCLRKKTSIREAARLYNIKRDTLMSRIRSVKKKGNEDYYMKSSDSGMSSDDEEDRKFQSKYSVNQVFSISEEENLVKYIKKSSALHYGLTYKQVRILAYEYASKLTECRMPNKWEENKKAGEDWLYGFMSRNPTLSLRRPESTSLLRSTGFNKDRVNEFFENYCSLLEKHKFKAEQIYNLDESGITTVMRPPRVVAEKGKNQVGQISSAERGELVTFVGIINAAGRALPPVYVVPRMRNPEEYITGAPASSQILNNKSGWMTKELFMKVLEHIKMHSHCTKEQPILLLLDNHESHVSYESITFCKENGISLLSFPPHTTHRIQPLDVGVFGPFKGSLSVAFDDWMLSNPGKPITIRNLGELSNIAFTKAFSMSNIISAFKKPGIWPVNRQVFSEDDFAASSVTEKIIEDKKTERETEHVNEHETNNSETTASTSANTYSEITASTMSTNNEKKPEAKIKQTDKSQKIDLEDIKPLPKANRTNKKNRKRERKSKIYTATPEMEEIRKKDEEKLRKNNLKLSKGTKHKVFKKIDEESSSEDDDESFELVDSDIDSSVEEFPIAIDDYLVVKVNDFVLARFCTKTTSIHYIGQVLKKDLNNYDIKFLRRKNNSYTFAFPVEDDIATVEREDIKAVFPPPERSGTARTSSLFKFKFNFKGWNVR